MLTVEVRQYKSGGEVNLSARKLSMGEITVHEHDEWMGIGVIMS